MERKGQVVATKEFRPQQGRQVNLWHLAPSGTPPQPASPPSFGDAQRYRARNRVYQRQPQPASSRRPDGWLPSGVTWLRAVLGRYAAVGHVCPISVDGGQFGDPHRLARARTRGGGPPRR